MCKMKKTSFVLFLSTIGLLILFGNLSSQQPAEELFEKALYIEEAQGDLQKAIGLYDQVLKQFPENREIAAKAQLHIGLCFEKLGLREATSAYQNVIQNYGEQKETVAKAKERLAKLTQPEGKTEEPEGIRIKQIWKKPYTDSLGSVSSDGRLFAWVYWGEGDVAIRDLISGEDRIITHEADLAKGFAMSPTISKNGKQVAYSWWKPHHTYDLLLVDVDNPSPRLLYRNEGEHVYPVTWLSDEELIISRFNYKTKIGQICSFSILDGTINVLNTYERKNWSQAACSPDEKYMAYDYADETESGNFDINIMAMEEGPEEH